MHTNPDTLLTLENLAYDLLTFSNLPIEYIYWDFRFISGVDVKHNLAYQKLFSVLFQKRLQIPILDLL